MKRYCAYLLLIFLPLSLLHAQNGLPDSVDALHYDLRLDIGHNESNRISGTATVEMRLLREMDTVALELLYSTIESVTVDGTATPYNYQAPLLRIPVDAAAGDTLNVAVTYSTGEHVMTNGWGGFYFDANIYYNLGISIYDYPHNCGKSWFPCRDNFTDKASYRFHISAAQGWKAICNGLLDSVSALADGGATYHWTLSQQTPTYLVGVAVAPFHIIEREYPSLYATYPALLGFIQHDSTQVERAFSRMEPVIPMYERCFGPYRWERVGYVSTPKGSMEHCGNIAFTTYCMSSTNEDCIATMAHEFAHSWFGNLITCASSADMWINEGGATFCQEVAIQALNGDSNATRYKDYADENLLDVLLHAHYTDNGFKPLYGQTPEYTYGSTVYNKGATVWHSLRGYLGDSLFYATLNTLFERCAFGNLDSWQLRDSLSLYSGTDLTDFFDFHVFGPGFNDYEVDSLRTSGATTTVYLSQRLYGADTLANSNRVWVTFFSDRRESAKRLVTFDGAHGAASFELPFTPVLAFADYDRELSKASLRSEETLTKMGQHEMPQSFFKYLVRKFPSGDTAWLHVTHHFTPLENDGNPGILRMASRHWTVEGIIPSGMKMNGEFQFARTGTNRALDAEFLPESGSIDSVALLYRANSGERWQMVETERHGNNSGYFTLGTVNPGQYILAVVDTNTLTLFSPDEEREMEVKIYPNPTTGRCTIETDRSGEPLLIDISDQSGRRLQQGLTIHSGQSFDTRLATGVYHFHILRPGSRQQATVKVSINNF